MELGIRIIDAARSALSDLVFVTDPTGRCLYLCESAAHLIGTDRAALVGRSLWDSPVQSPEVAASLHSLSESTLNANEMIAGCVTIRRQNGVQERFALACKPLHSTDGDEIEALAITATGIDGQGPAKTQPGARDGSDTLFGRILQPVENTPLAVIEWTRDLRVAHWSRRAQTLFGWSSDEALGRTAEQLGIVAPEHAGRLDADLNDLLTGRRASSSTACRNVSKESAILHCTWYNSPLGSQAGAGYVLSFVLDTTDLHRAEEAHLTAEMRQWRFMRDVLFSVTEGRLILCDSADDLPERCPADAEAVDLRASDSVYNLRHATLRAAKAAGVPSDVAQDFEVAVGEASANAIRHAAGGTAQVCRSAEEGRVQVWVEDNGPGIHIDTLPRATLERGFTTAGSLGHGFWLMLKMAQRIWLFTGPGGTTVVLEQSSGPNENSWLSADDPLSF